MYRSGQLKEASGSYTTSCTTHGAVDSALLNSAHRVARCYHLLSNDSGGMGIVFPRRPVVYYGVTLKFLEVMLLMNA